MKQNKIKKAINVLQTQKDKSKAANFDFDSWKTHTASYIGFYLGKDSEEYKGLFQTGSRIYNMNNMDAEKRIFDRQDVPKICNLIDASIETLKVKGIYKAPKKNLISNISEGWLIAITSLLIGAYILVYKIGYWYGQHDEISIPTTSNPQYKAYDTTKDTSSSTKSKKMK